MHMSSSMTQQYKIHTSTQSKHVLPVFCAAAVPFIAASMLNYSHTHKHAPVAHRRLYVTPRLLAGAWDVWLPAVMAGL
jgi:hypothetical protein